MAFSLFREGDESPSRARVVNEAHSFEYRPQHHQQPHAYQTQYQNQNHPREPYSQQANQSQQQVSQTYQQQVPAHAQQAAAIRPVSYNAPDPAAPLDQAQQPHAHMQLQSLSQSAGSAGMLVQPHSASIGAMPGVGGGGGVGRIGVASGCGVWRSCTPILTCGRDLGKT